MKRTSALLLIVVVAAVAGLGGYLLAGRSGQLPASEPAAGVNAAQQYTCGMHPMVVTDEPGLCPICNMDLTPLKPSSPATSKAPAVQQEPQQFSCGMHPMVVTDEPGLCPICNMDLTPMKSKSSSGGGGGDRKIKYWVAPMDPTYIQDEPGKSPMGMDLVPVYEGDGVTGSVISVDPVTSQNMGVRTVTVARRDISRTIRTVGLIDYEEPKQYSVNNKVGGWVEKLYVDQTGQQVREGEPLLEIYSPDLVAAQQEHLLALENYKQLSQSPFPEIAEGAKRLLESSRKRLSYWDISNRQIEALERNGVPKKTLTIHSPYQGIVTMKMVNVGMQARIGMDLFQIADISNVWVYADIYEFELPWVKEGQDAEVEMPFVGGRIIEGRISKIYPYLEAKTRTVKARIDLDNADFELRPEMYVNVTIKAETVRDVLTIPIDAVLNSGDRRTVFVALGDGKFEPRQVKTGLQSKDGLVEVRQGLLDGEEVVVSAQFMLDSESKLREAIQKMLEPKVPASAGEDDESLDDLFGDDGEGEESLENLFEEDNSQ